MKKMKLYEPEDSMITLIRDNYSVLQSLGAFGISLGFGDKSVREVCEMQNVDTYTFLAVVNLALNGYHAQDDESKLSVPTLMKLLPSAIATSKSPDIPIERYLKSSLSCCIFEHSSHCPRTSRK